MVYRNILEVLPYRPNVGRSRLSRAACHEDKASDALLFDGIINEGIHCRGRIRDFGRNKVDGKYLLSVGENGAETGFRM